MSISASVAFRADNVTKNHIKQKSETNILAGVTSLLVKTHAMNYHYKLLKLKYDDDLSTDLRTANKSNSNITLFSSHQNRH